MPVGIERRDGAATSDEQETWQNGPQKKPLKSGEKFTSVTIHLQ
ncbi:MAG: hypothetical protein Q8921_05705 [Bacteroidota bacterium]|nr:hypothetical protein [Bacteroidota bacterium]